MNDKNFDLEERTALFGEAVIDFCKRISSNAIKMPLISQLIRAATSIGANYCEANNAESKLDFRHKVGISKKESRECMHFIRMIVKADESKKEEGRKLWQEAKELNLIFGKIYNSAIENKRFKYS